MASLSECVQQTCRSLVPLLLTTRSEKQRHQRSARLFRTDTENRLSKLKEVRNRAKYLHWKKDLESHRVIDLLPDRQAETSAQWMWHHPDITVVSRDRGSEYASAAAQGAPQAVQCADRFHIVKNLTEATQLLLARCQAEITATSQTPEKQPSSSWHA